jgi:hypothetical protein
MITNTPRALAVAATALALALAGCGGGDDRGGSGRPAATGEQAVKDTILKWTFEGDCDTMTDKFLEQQSFIGDNRQERCAYLTKTFEKPRYSPDDLKFRSVKVAGPRATVVVGSDISNIESTYTLLSQGGRWRIDEAD